MCEICSNLTVKPPERRRSDVFIVNFEQISLTNLMFPLLFLTSKCWLRQISSVSWGMSSVLKEYFYRYCELSIFMG